MADELVNVMFTIDAPLMQQLSDAFIFRRVQIAEAVIFKLPLKLADPQTVGQRRVNIGALFRRQHALIFRRIFHFTQMGNTLGDFNHHAAEVINHRQQHAANVVHLFRGDRIRMGGFKLTYRGHIPHAVDQGDDGFPDALLHDFFADDVAIRQRE